MFLLACGVRIEGVVGLCLRMIRRMYLVMFLFDIFRSIYDATCCAGNVGGGYI